jgi:heptosyltransferase-3
MRLVEKRWPVEHFAALGERLAAERGARLVLLAGPGDEPLLAELQARLPVHASALAVQWGQAGALARGAALYVGNDTGLTHVASASGAAVLAIFGPSDPRRYAPFAPPGRATTLWRETALPAEGVAGGVDRGFTWDRGVTVDEAVAAAEKLLAGGGRVDSTTARGL